jgi:hypothetical protein
MRWFYVIYAGSDFAVQRIRAAAVSHLRVMMRSF